MERSPAEAGRAARLGEPPLPPRRSTPVNSPVDTPVRTDPAGTAYSAALEVVAAAEPDVAAAIAGELASQRAAAQADRLGELRLARGAAGHGQLAVGQVRRGHRRPAVLRRLRAGRPGRDARGRARPGPVRRGPRLRPAAFRHRREPGRVLVDSGPPGGGAALHAAGVRTSTTWPGPTGTGCGRRSTRSACSAWRSTRAVT